MKICAVICEFNPFHNGHKYLLNKAREKSKCDLILCIMSGNFVQRAEPSIVPKEIRTAFALNNGADIVVELPLIYATAPAELFSKGAIKIINQIPSITHLAFGCENDNIDVLTTIAKLQSNESCEFKQTLSYHLNEGMSYPKAYSLTTSKMAQKVGVDSTMCDIILSKPNNLLAIEYLKQSFIQNLAISFTPILRVGSDYNEEKIQDEFSSATAIRQSILNESFLKLEQNLPNNTVKELLEYSKPFKKSIENFSKLLVYALRNYSLQDLLDSGEGIENKLKQNAQKYTSLDEILLNSKTKRYTYSRLKRISIQALFEIKKSDTLNLLNPPIRLLGISNDCKKYISKVLSSPIIKSKDYDNLDKNIYKKYVEIEEKAALVYSQIRESMDGTLYSYKLVSM